MYVDLYMSEFHLYVLNNFNSLKTTYCNFCCCFIIHIIIVMLTRTNSSNIIKSDYLRVTYTLHIPFM